MANSNSKNNPIVITDENGLQRTIQIVTLIGSNGEMIDFTDGSIDINMTNGGIVDANNSTTAVLGADQVFTGVTTEIKDYGIIYVITKSDQASATDGLSVQQSSDGTNWDHTDEYTINASSGKTFSFQAGAQYFRVVYTNGSTIQGYFRLQTILKKGNGKPSSHRIQDSIVNDDDAELVKSIIAIKTNDGTSYVNVDVQNPVPVDGDTVYCKDIDIARSDITGWTGAVCDPFNDLHTENINDSGTDPKTFSVHFNRTIVTNLIGLGCSEGSNFSNVKVVAIVSGDIEVVVADFSDDSTARTTQFFEFPNAGMNALRLEFHTTNEVCITNLFIPKLRVVSSVIQTSTVYATSYKPPYLLDGAVQDMAVDGSTTPVDYIYTATGIGAARWNRSFIDLQDGNQDFLPENFGSITNGLTNGVDIIVQKDGVETILENWKTNMDISMTCYDFTSPFRTGSYIGRWTINSDIGSPITLFPNDQIIIRINDNLTTLDAFRFRAKLRQ